MKPRQLVNRSLNAAYSVQQQSVVTNFLTLLDPWCWGKINNYSVYTQTDIVVDLSKDTSVRYVLF